MYCCTCQRLTQQCTVLLYCKMKAQLHVCALSSALQSTILYHMYDSVLQRLFFRFLTSSYFGLMIAFKRPSPGVWSRVFLILSASFLIRKTVDSPMPKCFATCLTFARFDCIYSSTSPCCCTDILLRDSAPRAFCLLEGGSSLAGLGAGGLGLGAANLSPAGLSAGAFCLGAARLSAGGALLLSPESVVQPPSQIRFISVLPSGSCTPHMPCRYPPQHLHLCIVKPGGPGVRCLSLHSRPAAQGMVADLAVL